MGDRRESSSFFIAPCLYNPTADFTPRGKPQSAPLSKAVRAQAFILNSFSNAFATGELSLISALEIQKSDSTIKGNTVGIIFSAARLIPLTMAL